MQEELNSVIGSILLRESVSYFYFLNNDMDLEGTKFYQSRELNIRILALIAKEKPRKAP